MEKNDSLDHLLERFEILVSRQSRISQEIADLRNEINSLKYSRLVESIAKNEGKEPDRLPIVTDQKSAEEQPIAHSTNSSSEGKISPLKSNVEKFIGENLINKIGIIITVIGVVIGAKYSIEHDLITPLQRIILGYLFGLGLMGLGISLKKKFRSYSSVLVSGAIAILYFITYSAYVFYNLIPQPLAFALMVLFTVLGVIASISYDLQVIAHVGLVGAYAVPFMVGGNSGNATVLFSYIAIINIGILWIASKKYWKPLYYSSFVFTWLIFGSWYLSKYTVTEFFEVSLLFISIFFIVFYLIFLDYKLFRKEKFDFDDILLLLSNSFIFYAFGSAILKSGPDSGHLLGIFTLSNAAIHFLVGWIIYRQKLADRNLFYFVVGLALVFITIAIPIQLNGNWVTLLWAGEALILFWIGRTKNSWIYEKLSYLILFLAFFSLIQDWEVLYHQYDPEIPGSRIIPLLNVHFLTSIICALSFGIFNYIYQKYPRAAQSYGSQELKSLLDFSIPAVFLITLYCSFAVEISNYWNQLYTDSFIQITKDGQTNTYWDHDLQLFRNIWMINYSFGFLTILMFVNNNKTKNYSPGLISVGLSAFIIFIYLTQGLFTLSELRESFLVGKFNQYYHHDSFHIVIRYISYVFVGLIFYSINLSLQTDFLKQDSIRLRNPFEILLSASMVWIASSEWINIMDLLHFTQSYRLGLSILWGISALILVIMGIWKRKRHLRIGAIVLFGITLIKLFFYDISHLNTIGKTVVFVSLGILLLIISFLYNRYKHFIYPGI